MDIKYLDNLRKQLDYLVKHDWIYGYTLTNDGELCFDYSLSSVDYTERVIYVDNKDLVQALFESGEDIRIDIESSLVDDDDFFGYDNKEELEDRIEEETEFLKRLSEIVKEIK